MRCILLLASVLPAQTVTATNNSAVLYRGWLRAELPAPPPALSGWHPVSHAPHYVVGQNWGEQETPVDLWVEVPPYSQQQIDMGAMAPTIRPLLQLPDDPATAWGGMPTINGTPLGWQLVAIDGAAARVRATAWVGLAYWSLDFLWYPGQPWVVCDLRVASHNTWQADTDYRIVWGSAQTAPVIAVPAGTTLLNGQAMAVRSTVWWTQLLREPADLDRALASHAGTVWAAVQ
jgi:hypothetical protein